jgi:serine phosphatase RsbU (regulator of sigma subunit)
MLSAILHQIPLFSSLNTDQLEALFANLTELRYEAGTVLVWEGELGDTFCVILEGQADVLKAIHTINEQALDRIGQGGFFGEMSLLSRSGLRTASVRAQTELRVLEMNREQFTTLLERQPAVAYEVLCQLSARLEATTSNAIRDLTERNERLAQAYADLKAAQAQIIEQEILERELLQAQEIQRSMLPLDLPRLAGYEIGARMVPARMVGGDFYNVMELDDDHVALVLGDVSGKGIPAALFMALTSSLVRAEALADLDSPAAVLCEVNEHLCAMNAKGMFVTLIYGILQRSTRQFAYVRAGHELPLLWNCSGEVVELPEGKGQFLGIFNPPLLDLNRVELPKGSTLLLYSDGVTEARNTQGEFLEDSGLSEIVPGLLDSTAQVLCDRLVQFIHDFTGDQLQADDITLLAVKVLD